MALSSLACLEPEMQTSAPCSMAASATQKPMPDVPPKMSTRVPWSFEVYLVGDIMLKKGRFRVPLLRTFCWMGGDA